MNENTSGPDLAGRLRATQAGLRPDLHVLGQHRERGRKDQALQDAGFAAAGLAVAADAVWDGGTTAEAEAIGISGDSNSENTVSVQGIVITDSSAALVDETVDLATFESSYGYTYGVGIAGNHAYVTTDIGGLKVIDVTVPNAPIQVGAVATAD